jgi:hypothetical protein
MNPVEIEKDIAALELEIGPQGHKADSVIYIEPVCNKCKAEENPMGLKERRSIARKEFEDLIRHGLKELRENGGLDAMVDIRYYPADSDSNLSLLPCTIITEGTHLDNRKWRRRIKSGV